MLEEDKFKMLRIRMIQCFALGLMMVGCIPPDNGPTDTPSIPSQIIATQTTTVTITPPTTQTSTPHYSAVQECVELSASPPESALEGILILEKTEIIEYREGDPLPLLKHIGHFLDLETMSRFILSPQGELYSIVGVSPDRTKLLYTYERGNITRDSYRLVISDYQGITLLDFSNWTENYRWDYYTWLNNESLRTVEIEYPKAILLGIYNPFTEEYSRLKTEWGEYYYSEFINWALDSKATDIGAYIGANILYDPTMTRVLYPQSQGLIELADIQTDKVISSFQSGIPRWGRIPRWSDDGKNLAIILSGDPARPRGSDEFYLLSRDGALQRVTDLSLQHETIHISEYSWSPDGRQIAFWLNTTADDPTVEGTQSNLAIFDLETKQVTDLCIQGISTYTFLTHENYITFPHFQPIWSADGNKVIFVQLDPDDTKSYNVIIVDLVIKTAWIVDSNKQPVDWMVKEP